ncbi:MAG: 3-deoxy-D-manno-octulosonic acid transferase, partial [Pedobacter sp.]
LYIISGIFRPGQIYFRWYGGFNRKILNCVTHFFLQNEESRFLLESINIRNVTISGDTRFDRVAENAQTAKQLPDIEQFCAGKDVLIAGSTWPADEELLNSLIDLNPDWKFIIAPHEIDEAHISSIKNLLPEAITYSTLKDGGNAQILIIDNIGLLSSIYQYGKIAYIGGGFGVGIHNTLEAAAFGMPVIFGPNYQRFQEAKDLIKLNAAQSISTKEELIVTFKELTASTIPGQLAIQYVDKQKGSTEAILQQLSPILEIKEP